MFNNLQFRKLIIQPVLKALMLNGSDIEDLLVGTCAQESRGGTFLFQEGTNPDLYASLQKNILAIGPYQMQPATHDDIWENYLPSHPNLLEWLIEICAIPPQLCLPRKKPPANFMLYNLYYATAMARIHYRRVPEPVPSTLELQAEYYKKYYNTSGGKATIDEYITNYNNFVGTKK